MNEELVIQIKAEISDLKKQVNEANKKVKTIGTDGEKSVSKLNSSLKNLAKTIAATFSVAAIVNFTKEIVNCAAEVAAEEAAFTQIMGEYADAAAAKMSGIADATGMVDSRLATYMTSMTAKFKGLGYGIEEATDLAAQGLNMAADASAFWDMSLDESVSHLNSFINGSYEGGEAIGLFANDTQMALYALEEGIIKDTKAWSSLDEATKQATRLQYAQNMLDLSGATGQAAKEADSYANVQANLNEKWRIFKAEIGEPVLQNIAIPGMQMLSDVIDKASQAYEDFCNWLPTGKAYFEELGCFIEETFAPAIETLSPIFEEVGEFFSPLVDKVKEYVTEGELAADANTLLYDTISAVGDIALTVSEGIAGVVDKLKEMKQWVNENETAVQLITIAVGTLTTALVAYNIAQAISNAGGIAAIASNAALTVGYYALVAAETIATTVTSAFGAVMAFVTSPITLVIVAIGALVAAIVLCVKNWEKIKETVSKVVDSIKEKISEMKEKVVSKFEEIKTNVTSKVEELKTKISTKFSEIKDKITKPVEEAKEAVSKVVDKIKGFFDFEWSLPALKVPKFTISPQGWSVGDLLKGSIPKLSVSWYAEGGVFDKPTLFSGNGVLSGLGENGAEAVVPLENNLGWLDKLASMLNERMGGGAPIVLEVDGRVFAQTAISTINRQTRQTGKLALNLV